VKTQLLHVMDELAMKTQLYYVMNYGELEKLITKTYALKESYEFVAMELLGNDSSWVVHVEKEPLDEWQETCIQQLKAGQPNEHSTQTIMQDMVNNGQLPEGHYLVEVCW
jgi:hypothetical protein